MMKSLKKMAISMSVFTALLCVTGCLRMSKGEDVFIANKIEVLTIKESLVYFKDDYGNCFATLNNHTADFRTTFTITTVGCDRMP